jgi:hypothetical protein
LKVEVSSNSDDLIKALDQFGKQRTKWIIKDTIDNTLKDLHLASKRLAERQLDRPRKQTLNSFRIKKSKTSDLQGNLFVLPWATKFLYRLVHGGTEVASRDGLLPVPVALKTNAQGNIAGLRTGRLKKLSRKKSNVGLRHPANNKSGVWKYDKATKKLKTLVIYQDRRRVKKQLYWYEMLNNRAPKVLSKEFDKKLKKEIERLESKNA